MVGQVSFQSVPTFGGSAAKTQPPAPNPYTNGYLPTQSLPAQHLNWLLNGLTGNENLATVALNKVIEEVGGLVTDSGLTVTPSEVDQVAKATRRIAGQIPPHAVASADYVVLSTDGYSAIEVTTGAADRTITLPARSTNPGRRLIVRKVDSGVGKVIVVRAGSDTINGLTSWTISDQYGAVELRETGAEWAAVAYAGTTTIAVTSTPFSTSELSVPLATVICSSTSAIALDVSAGASLSGQRLIIVNINTGLVTLTVTTGAATVSLKQGEWISLIWNGTDWQYLGGSSQAWLYTTGTAATWLAPWTGRFIVKAIGGGGGGGAATGSNALTAAGGGGGGAKGQRSYYLVAGTSCTYTVGAGGASSEDGAATTFTDGTTLLTASGGAQGIDAATGTVTDGGEGGGTTNGDLNFTGEAGGNGAIVRGNRAVSGLGGASGGGFFNSSRGYATSSTGSMPGGSTTGSTTRFGVGGAGGPVYNGTQDGQAGVNGCVEIEAA